MRDWSLCRHCGSIIGKIFVGQRGQQKRWASFSNGAFRGAFCASNMFGPDNFGPHEVASLDDLYEIERSLR